jgi:hypothetical protein
MFGSGIGFVWYAEISQQEEVVERALIHEVQASLIAVHESRRGRGGDAAERGRHAI